MHKEVVVPVIVDIDGEEESGDWINNGGVLA